MAPFVGLGLEAILTTIENIATEGKQKFEVMDETSIGWLVDWSVFRSGRTGYYFLDNF